MSKVTVLSDYYVIELYDPGTESWVVIDNVVGLNEAINRLRTQVLNSEQQYRLTTPRYSE